MEVDREVWEHDGNSLVDVNVDQWKEWMGKPVTGFFGSLWTTFWHLMWGSGMVDAFVRCGIVANDFVPKQMRIGKAMVDVVLAVVATSGH
jgi:hypothetical protein